MPKSSTHAENHQQVADPTSSRRPHAHPLQRFVVPCLLLGTLLVGITLRLYGAAMDPGINSDEGISLLAATGHEGEYNSVFRESNSLYKQWTNSSALRRLILPEHAFCFQTISQDLARTDIHPPFYFWILHVWILIFGVHPWTGLSLNLVFFLLSGLALFALSARILRHRVEAAAVVALWACSPMVVQLSYEARPYECLALFTILFTYMVVHCSDCRQRPRWGSYVLLALICAGGLLTHFHFVFAILAGAVYAIVTLMRHQRKALSLGTLSVIVGVCLAMVLHPVVTHASKQTGKLLEKRNDTSTPTQRLKIAYDRYSAFMLDPQVLPESVEKPYRKWLPFVFMTGLGISLIATFRRRRRRSRTELKGLGNGAPFIFFFLCYAVTNIGLYVAGISPPHAMAAKYPCMAWPFAGAILVLMTRALPGRVQSGGLAVLCIGMVVSSCYHVNWSLSPSQRLTEGMGLSVDWPMIVDNPSRLHLPRLLFEFADNRQVLVAPPEHLADHYEEWSPQLSDQNLLFSFVPGEKGRAALRRLANRMESDYQIERVNHAAAGYQSFTIVRK